MFLKVQVTFVSYTLILKIDKLARILYKFKTLV